MAPKLTSNAPPNGYEQMYLGYTERLGSLDFEEAAPRLGLELCGEASVKVRLLGREYHIDRQGVTPPAGAKDTFNHRSVLAYYLLSKGSGEPTGEYAPPSAARESLLASGLNGLDWMSRRLAETATESFADFSAALERLGCEKLETGSATKHLWSLPLLPKIPAQVLCYEADDEFPCEIKILYDTGAHRFMEFEAMAFLNGCVIDTISQLCGAGTSR